MISAPAPITQRGATVTPGYWRDPERTRAAFDALGEEVSRSQVPAEYQNQPVLSQLPEAGAIVDAATTRLRLVVAAAIREEPIVTMPSLIGLTQAEAAKALEKIGLRLGKITVRS